MGLTNGVGLLGSAPHERRSVPEVRATFELPSGQLETLDLLARLMVGRHLQVSIPNEAQRDCFLPKVPGPSGPRPFLYDEAGGRAVRVVLLVGAGSSHPYLKRANDLAEQLVRDAELDPQGFTAARDRLQRLYGLAPDRFETILAAFGRTPYTEGKARQVLSETHAVRYPAVLGYELAAHLLKHRFLDAIVNFNFDELLDSSVDDELGRDEYVRILSARDCHGVEFNPGSPDYRPLYIKPHGTASEPESLRFTVESYFDGSRHVSEAMQALLGSGDCVLITYGFGLTGPAFLDLLATSTARLRIFNLSFDQIHLEGFEQAELIEEGLGRGGDLSYSGRTVEVDLGGHRASLNQPGWEVNEEADVSEDPDGDDRWPLPPHVASQQMLLLADAVRRVGDETGDLVAFRSIGRHLAMTSAARPSLVPLPETEPPTDILRWYLQDRTTLELAFALVQSRGFASLERLTVDRSGSYYDRYKAALGSKRWQELCAGIHAVPTTASDSTFSVRGSLQPGEVLVKTETSAKSQPPARFGAEDEQVMDIDPAAMATVVIKALRRPAEGIAGALAATFRDAQAGTEVEIHSYDDRVCDKLFRDPRTLPTFTAMEGATRTMFLAHKGVVPTHFLLTAESGEWFLRALEREDGYLTDWLGAAADQVNESPIRVTLIAAESRYFDDIRIALRAHAKSAATTVHFAACQMDWWDHNRHATVACVDDSPHAALYFARRLRGLFITPMSLHDHRDAGIVFRHQVRMADVCFQSAWDRADRVGSEGIVRPRDQKLASHWERARSAWPMPPRSRLVHQIVDLTARLQRHVIDVRASHEQPRAEKSKRSRTDRRPPAP